MADPQTARAVIFPSDPDQPVTAGTVDVTKPGPWALIGGQPEIVALDPARAALRVHSYGKTEGLQPNPRATRFVDTLRPGFARTDMIMGPSVLLGYDEDGMPDDVPPDVERSALA